MTTATLPDRTRPAGRAVADDDDRPGLNHWMSKAAITRSIVEGIPARALCGERSNVTGRGADALPGNECASRRYEICPDCATIYAALTHKRPAR